MIFFSLCFFFNFFLLVINILSFCFINVNPARILRKKKNLPPPRDGAKYIFSPPASSHFSCSPKMNNYKILCIILATLFGGLQSLPITLNPFHSAENGVCELDILFDYTYSPMGDQVYFGGIHFVTPFFYFACNTSGLYFVSNYTFRPNTYPTVQGDCKFDGFTCGSLVQILRVYGLIGFGAGTIYNITLPQNTTTPTLSPSPTPTPSPTSMPPTSSGTSTTSDQNQDNTTTTTTEFTHTSGGALLYSDFFLFSIAHFLCTFVIPLF